MTALFFTEIFHKVVTLFLWIIILHGISTVTWCMNSWYTYFCNFEQILFVEGTPVIFCITILDLACFYNIPQIPSEDFPHLSTNWNICTIVFHYTSLSLSNIYLAAYSIFWVCVLILWVLLLSLWVMGGLIGNLIMTLTFCISKRPCTYLVLGTCILKKSWNKMSCKALRFIYWVLFHCWGCSWRACSVMCIELFGLGSVQFLRGMG